MCPFTKQHKDVHFQRALDNYNVAEEFWELYSKRKAEFLTSRDDFAVASIGAWVGIFWVHDNSLYIYFSCFCTDVQLLKSARKFIFMYAFLIYKMQVSRCILS